VQNQAREISKVNSHPRLHTLSRGAKVRHLLIDGDDPAAKSLIQLENGVRTVVATGTEYEMGEKAKSMIRRWTKTEGFKRREDGGPPVFESLQPTMTLVTLMGYTKIYDPKQKKGRNLLGEVPLAQWPGWRDKNGADYEYGFTGTTIYGQPKVTAKHGLNMTPKTDEELFAALKKAIAIRKSLGPENTFIIG
jgi:hypothetical protein